MAGWVKTHRDIQQNWIWEDKPFARGQAFIDLTLMVNHENKKIMFNGSLIEVKRGSGITSLKKLGERWGWSKNKVKHFLEQLQNDKMLTFKSDTKKTIVTIENYSVYQDKNLEKGHQKDSERTLKDIKRETEGKQKDTNKNVKEYINNDKEREEGKEEAPVLIPLCYPTPTHKIIYEQFGEVAYRTWFFETTITESTEGILITSSEDFKNQIIKNKYTDTIARLTGKVIKVGGVNE